MQELRLPILHGIFTRQKCIAILTKRAVVVYFSYFLSGGFSCSNCILRRTQVLKLILLAATAALLRLFRFRRNWLNLEKENVEEITNVLHHTKDEVKIHRDDEDHIHGRCHNCRD